MSGSSLLQCEPDASSVSEARDAGNVAGYSTAPPLAETWERLPRRMTPEMATLIERISPRTVLDVGCGNGELRGFFSSLGAECLGLDIEHDGADILADAHALPLADERFDLVVSMQALEYLWDPHGAVRQIARVLKRGGSFVGSAAFLEPMHGSLFHPTPDGVASVLRNAGLTIDRIWPMRDWTPADALHFHVFSQGSLIERVGGRLLCGLEHILWHYAARSFHPFRLGRRRDSESVSRSRLRWSGAICFCAHKPVGSHK